MTAPTDWLATVPANHMERIMSDKRAVDDALQHVEDLMLVGLDADGRLANRSAARTDSVAETARQVLTILTALRKYLIRDLMVDIENAATAAGVSSHALAPASDRPRVLLSKTNDPTVRAQIDQAAAQANSDLNDLLVTYRTTAAAALDPALAVAGMTSYLSRAATYSATPILLAAALSRLAEHDERPEVDEWTH